MLTPQIFEQLGRLAKFEARDAETLDNKRYLEQLSKNCFEAAKTSVSGVTSSADRLAALAFDLVRTNLRSK